MSDKPQDLNPTGGARRRLMRGAFAAPALLTLHSGSAFAQASATSCLAKANLSPVTPTPLPSAADDTYFRYQLYTIRNNSGQIQSAWVKGKELEPFVRPGLTPFIGSAQWQEFRLGSGANFNKLIGSPTTTTPTPGNNQTFGKNGPYVVIRVDANGAIVGMGDSGPGTAVGDSCWNSFAMNVPV